MDSLEPKSNITKYLTDYHDGKILEGYGVRQAKLDKHLRAKASQLTIINGLDNTGKTVWMLWYFLCLSVRHGLKWLIYSGENKSGQLVRQLIQFYTGKHLKNMELREVFHVEQIISQWFVFVDNKPFYKTTELFKIFQDNDCFGCLIDPYTGMNREYTHSANYDFLNESRAFCNSTGKSLYVNTHVVSEAARYTFPKGHEYEAYPYPPSKSQSEGGQPFGNRTDDFLTIHRLVGHPTRNYYTEVYVRKIKDTETGGKVNAIDDPMLFDFNRGLGFMIDGQNILNATVTMLGHLPNNDEFDTDNNDFPF